MPELSQTRLFVCCQMLNSALRAKVFFPQESAVEDCESFPENSQRSHLVHLIQPLSPSYEQQQLLHFTDRS